MNQDAWPLFPRLIEKKINNLLAQAEPNNTKAYQLYKTCKNENLWQNSFELFSVHLSDYYSLPEAERVKSYFDKFLDRPMNRIIYDSFHLTFRTAYIDSRALLDTANWSHNIMKSNCSPESLIISVDVLTKTLHYITAPPPYEKEQDIEFEDFCIAWKKTVFMLFGKKHDHELEKTLKEIRLLNKIQKNAGTLSNSAPEQIKFIAGIYLTQTEIDWTASVQKAAFEYKPLPKFPLLRGLDKEKLIGLERTRLLYNIILTSPRAELMQHQESLRSTILDQCSWLLKKKSA